MGCIVLVLGVGRCAFRPPRVVFVLGLVSLKNSLTSGKKVSSLLALLKSQEDSVAADELRMRERSINIIMNGRGQSCA